MDIVMIFKSEPAVILEKIVFPGMSKLDFSAQLLFKPFMALFVHVLVFVLEAAYIAENFVVNHLNYMKRVNNGYGIGKILVYIAYVRSVHIADQVFNTEPFGFRD